MTEEELVEIEERWLSATPGPWYVRYLDDVYAMNLVAVSVVPDTGRGERWPDFDYGEVIAATLVQEPRYVDIRDAKSGTLSGTRMPRPSLTRPMTSAA